MVDDAELLKFQDIVWQHFEKHGRHELPWRDVTLNGDPDPYHILVSEIMLQQTQVGRVVPKYVEFITYFPTIETLADASLAEVLRLWSGLGYNRRAKYLWQAAQVVKAQHNSRMPRDPKLLVKLPGIGKSTAAAIQAYAFNRRAVFVETNIRTVFIFHFLSGQKMVTDQQILALVEKTLPVTGSKQPALYREWYWALMDYGTFLKQTIGNLNKLSKSYTKQTPFVGSKRQIRGQVIRLLGEKPLSKHELAERINDERLSAVLADLTSEALIQKSGAHYGLRHR